VEAEALPAEDDQRAGEREPRGGLRRAGTRRRAAREEDALPMTAVRTETPSSSAARKQRSPSLHQSEEEEDTGAEVDETHCREM